MNSTANQGQGFPAVRWLRQNLLRMFARIGRRWREYWQGPSSSQEPGQQETKTTVLAANQSNPAGPLAFGMILILVAFGGLGGWAAVAPLESAVMAPGTIMVESELKVVQHLEGGIVSRIFVNDGDVVNEGDLLLTLDDTRTRAVYEIVKSQHDAARALEARLVAERDDNERIDFPPSLLEDPDPEARRAVDGQQALFEARRLSLKGQIDILNQRIEQFREEIDGLQAQEEARALQVDLFEKELEGLRKLAEEGSVPVNYVLAKERDTAALRGERGKFRSDVARARQGIGEARLQITQLQKVRSEEVTMQLREIQDAIADQKERIVAARDSLQRTEIRAPATGMVFGLAVHTPNAVIRSGDSILYIVPEDDELIMEARARITDIDDVAIDQAATIRFTALSFRDTPIIDGRVIYVSPDSQIDENTGVAYYAVKIRVPPDELAKLEGVHLQPGMPVDVLIKTGSQTALVYLLKPFQDMMAKAFLEK